MSSLFTLSAPEGQQRRPPFRPADGLEATGARLEVSSARRTARGARGEVSGARGATDARLGAGGSHR